MSVLTIDKPVLCECKMADTETLKSDQIDAFLRQTIPDGLCGTMSCLRQGKWCVSDVVALAAEPDKLSIQVQSDKINCVCLKKEQPVGLCFQYEHHKYIFESRITDAPNPDNPTVLTLEMPEKIEKMLRRAYERQPVPAELNVRVLFWHRAYADHIEAVPQEHYWQGRLENLSAGGALICVESEILGCFAIDQSVGVQFTPMAYQKPFLLEGLVRHLQIVDDRDGLLVGVEFVGLEASPEGRDILHRLLDVIDAYDKMNHTDA